MTVLCFFFSIRRRHTCYIGDWSSYLCSSDLFLDRTKGAAQGPGFFGLNYPYIFPASEKLLPTRIPSVNMTNFSTLNGGPYPSHSTGPIFDISDSVTWIRGNHTFKFCVLYVHSGEHVQELYYV